MAHKNKYDVTVTINLIVEVDSQFDELDPEFDVAVRDGIKNTLSGSIKDMITHVEEIPSPEKMNNHE